jgi:hypothetical protein
MVTVIAKNDFQKARSVAGDWGRNDAPASWTAVLLRRFGHKAPEDWRSPKPSD